MRRKSRKCKKLAAILFAVFSLSLVLPEMAESLGTMQCVQAAVKLNSRNLKLVKGQKKTLKLTGTKKRAKWSSNNKSVAAVTSKGVVTARKKGTAVITAKIGKKKYTCKVVVSNKADTSATEFRRLCSYVSKNGQPDYSGSKIIRKRRYDTNTVSTYTTEIEYDEMNKTLFFTYIDGTKSEECYVRIEVPKKLKTATAFFNYSYKEDGNAGDLLLKATFNMKTYKRGQDLKFETILTPGGESLQEDVNLLGNYYLHAGFRNWQSFLKKEMGMKLGDIGFMAYK